MYILLRACWKICFQRWSRPIPIWLYSLTIPTWMSLDLTEFFISIIFMTRHVTEHPFVWILFHLTHSINLLSFRAILRGFENNCFQLSLICPLIVKLNNWKKRKPNEEVCYVHFKKLIAPRFLAILAIDESVLKFAVGSKVDRWILRKLCLNPRTLTLSIFFFKKFWSMNENV